jgi:hypothetical protein
MEDVAKIRSIEDKNRRRKKMVAESALELAREYADSATRISLIAPLTTEQS